MDYKALARELRAEQENRLERKLKLTWMYEAVAAGFGYRTLAGLMADGAYLQSGNFQKIYFEIRLNELVKKDEKRKERDTEQPISLFG